MTGKTIGERVRWTSSNLAKEGVVVAVVPAGRRPRDVGYVQLGETGLSRGHESYVIKGGPKGGRSTLYWPQVSTLQSASGLGPDEIAWCHENAEAVRALMKATPSS